MIFALTCAMVALWIFEFFFHRRPESTSISTDEKKPAFEQWITRNATQLARLVFISIGLMWIYGVYFYPDAPIAKCGETYCGKQGEPHTRGDFQAFENWQGLLVLTFIVGFVALIYLRTRIPPDRKN